MTTATQHAPVDTLYTGGNIVTSDPEPSIVRNAAIAVCDGTIVAIGPAAEVVETVGRPAREFDFSGLTLLPGMINGHTFVRHRASFPQTFAEHTV